MRIRRLDTFVIAGSVFAFVGAVLLTAGALAGINMAAILASPNAHIDGDPEFLVWMLCGMGGLSLAIGLVLLFAWLRRHLHDMELVRRGNYIFGEIVDIRYDWSTMINGAPGLELMFREAGRGLEGREFLTGPFRQTEYLLGSKRARVKIYLGDGPDDYYVDMSTFEQDRSIFARQGR